jgi:hypothetical protein
VVRFDIFCNHLPYDDMLNARNSIRWIINLARKAANPGREADCAPEFPSAILPLDHPTG